MRSEPQRSEDGDIGGRIDFGKLGAGHERIDDANPTITSLDEGLFVVSAPRKTALRKPNTQTNHSSSLSLARDRSPGKTRWP